MIMSMKAGKFILVALIVGLVVSVSVSSGLAQPVVAGADQKIKRLEGCIDHFKQARSGWSTDSSVQQSYTIKIKGARDMITALKGGQDVSEEEIKEACESPHTAPY
jgi:outer membrane lipoprotein-sorting protein